MKLEERIEYLKGIVSKYTVDEIEKLYREEEVQNLKDHLAKHPDVKYSDSMMKKMIRQAKSKRISPGRKNYLERLIQNTSKFNYALHIEKSQKKVDEFITTLKNKIEGENRARLIHIEHDYSPTDFTCVVYGESDGSKYSNELLRFNIDFDFSSIWGFIDDNKYQDLCELLYFIEFDEENYMYSFEELAKLRSYKLMQIAFNEHRMEKELGLKNLLIEFGEHDNWIFEIFKC
ncbi:hypothetical protein [Flavilitoribacter nigricans]|uniref:Uncharacterized protein n=1 Tax=Flavilitoribacter nigricans (strain ATCC 23147 / DSM 23189 / NBRC 102662 / NCIMB 1420 / SS-2) TaxID=1122177 RepID=A0A2D0N2C6_FLAN2|nr:hypothetical protein [Flavilitoribacter nigricans]PHN02570.1 hypothetical protein CRP01_31845 [Flavilitoribacter nigricans DSM 23189 = NBRC 102662]